MGPPRRPAGQQVERGDQGVRRHCQPDGFGVGKARPPFGVILQEGEGISVAEKQPAFSTERN